MIGISQSRQHGQNHVRNADKMLARHKEAETATQDENKFSH